MEIEVHKSKDGAVIDALALAYVTVDKSGMVTNFVSGKNEKNFYEAISNGIYSLDLMEKKKKEVQESDQEDGVEGSLQIQCAGEIALETDNSSSGLEGETSLSKLFGVKAPPHYVFYGLFNFVCFGPLTEKISKTLAFGTPPLLQTPADRKENSRNAQRRNEHQQRDAEREVGHERGMTMQSELTMGLITHKEDEADREEHQMRLLLLSKEINTYQKLLDTKILIAKKTMAASGSSI